jgi:hypothetical protein
MSKYIQIIVSRYNETLDWTLEYPFNLFKYVVYNKGPNQNFFKENVNQIINLANVGRCDHTYLYHIVTNYNDLATITVFFPGSIGSIANKKIKAIKILKNILIYKNAIFLGTRLPNDVKTTFNNFVLNSWVCSDPINSNLNPEKKLFPATIRPFGKWFTFHFGNIKVKYYCMQGILSIHKNDIIKYPISRYQQLLAAAGMHSNPEVGHYIERSWGAIFYPLIFTKII